VIGPNEARFDWGQRVVAQVDLYNDGSYPDVEPDALLVRAGEQGEIVQVGVQQELNRAVYLVEFGPARVVGCFEEELSA